MLKNSFFSYGSLSKNLLDCLFLCQNVFRDKTQSSIFEFGPRIEIFIYLTFLCADGGIPTQ